MALFSRIGNYLWSYVSPKKTQKRREKPFRSPSPAPRQPLDTASRVHQWREKQKAAKLAREVSVDAEELEGDTLIDTSFTEATPASHRFSTPGDEYDAHESTLVMTEEEQANEALEPKAYFDPVEEEKRSQSLAAELRDIGWSESAIKAYLLLDSMGRRPLLPKTWDIDFETIPDLLFSSEDEEVFIKSASGKSFRASTNLGNLIQLGPKVRDSLEARRQHLTSHKPPENVSKKAIKEYLKWAYTDVNIKIASGSSRHSLDNALAGGSMLPLAIFESGAKDVGGAILQANALERLIALGERWKAVLRNQDSSEYIAPLPTLYAFVSTYTIVGVIAYDIDVTTAEGEPIEPFVRTVTFLNFDQKGHDVWNALSIAILAVHVRNELLKLQDIMNAGSTDEEEEGSKGDDPDA